MKILIFGPHIQTIPKTNLQILLIWLTHLQNFIQIGTRNSKSYRVTNGQTNSNSLQVKIWPHKFRGKNLFGRNPPKLWGNIYYLLLLFQSSSPGASGTSSSCSNRNRSTPRRSSTRTSPRGTRVNTGMFIYFYVQ